MNKLVQNFDIFENKRQGLIQLLKNIEDEKLNLQPKLGKWSVIQVIWHLISAEGNAVKYVQKKSQGKEGLGKAGWGSAFRALVLKIAFSLPIKFKAPKIVEEVPEYETWEKTLTTWNQVRMDLRELLQSFSEEDAQKPLFKHPIAGKMNLYQMLEFMEHHADRHFEQIKALIAS